VRKALWSEKYFIRSVGEEVSSEVICPYVKYEQQKQIGFEF